MKYTLQLCFSDVCLSSLKGVFKELDSPVLSKGDRPHLTLSVFEGEKENEAQLIQRIEALLRNEHPFELRMGSIGCFPSEDNVVFLAPIASTRLIEQHQRISTELLRSKFQLCSLYSEGRWIPHVGVYMGVAYGKNRLIEQLLKKDVFKSYTLDSVELIRMRSSETFPSRLIHRLKLKTEQVVVVDA